MSDFARILIFTGAALLLGGVLLLLASRLGLGRLPGDVVVRRGNFTFYLPLLTSIILSVVLSLLLWFFGRRP